MEHPTEDSHFSDMDGVLMDLVTVETYDPDIIPRFIPYKDCNRQWHMKREDEQMPPNAD